VQDGHSLDIEIGLLDLNYCKMFSQSFSLKKIFGFGRLLRLYLFSGETPPIFNQLPGSAEAMSRFGLLNSERPLRKTIAPCVLALVIIAVTARFGYAPLDEPLNAEARPSKLTLFNNTPFTLWYAAFEQNAATTTQWKPCGHPDLCPSGGIDPGRSRDIPYVNIYHWYPGARVTVYWWRLVPETTAADGYRVEGLEHMILATPKQPLLGL
jgi:hypothetical protein